MYSYIIIQNKWKWRLPNIWIREYNCNSTSVRFERTFTVNVAESRANKIVWIQIATKRQRSFYFFKLSKKYVV